ncbi:autophagy-related protein 22-like protein [Russula ochroleuca]|uniref:Autophagy-related protein n=1 Tax=Russula ochroleuca TaxID=152965 RepID=A0A9P5MS20_9AGAM|nr:autophagy-related protein 22-like protein [Russula ochroleuca]
MGFHTDLISAQLSLVPQTLTLRLCRTRLLFFNLFFLFPSSSSIWLIFSLLAILANTGFGASIIVLNDTSHAVSSLPFLDHGDTKKLSRATARIYSLGIALGCTAGVLLLLVTVLSIQRAGGSTDALRFAMIGGSGAWWALFSIPTLLLLPGTRGFEEAQNAGVTEECEGLLTSEPTSEAASSFLMDSRHSTSTALLFAKTTLHMPPSSLVLVGVLTPSAGILDALLWPILQHRLSLTSPHVLILLIIAAGVIGLFASCGARWDLRVPAEMFVLAVYFGGLYGASQSCTRALYAEIIPPGEEARWYGLFSIADKSSSFIGPLVVRG